MRSTGLSSREKGKVKKASHRSGNLATEHRTQTAVIVPFYVQTIGNKSVKFNINFDVIEGNLPFPVGMPALEALETWINCKSKILGIWIDGRCSRIQLHQDGTHLYLPLNPPSSSYYSCTGSVTESGKVNVRYYYPESILNEGLIDQTSASL